MFSEMNHGCKRVIGRLESELTRLAKVIDRRFDDETVDETFLRERYSDLVPIAKHIRSAAASCPTSKVLTQKDKKRIYGLHNGAEGILDALEREAERMYGVTL